MKIVILIALMLATGQVSASPAEQVISVQHDSQRGVTCWIVNNSGISCLPDSSLPQGRASIATPKGEASQASQANSTGSNAQSIAAPPPQDQRFKL